MFEAVRMSANGLGKHESPETLIKGKPVPCESSLKCKRLTFDSIRTTAYSTQEYTVHILCYVAVLAVFDVKCRNKFRANEPDFY